MVCRRDSSGKIGLQSAHGVFPRTGNGVPGAAGVGKLEDVAGAWTAAEGGAAEGAVDGPGCVPGGAGGGLFVAAGWFRFSEVGPLTVVGLGVPLALIDGAGAGDAAKGAAPAAGALGSGVIGFAGTGDFWASSATVNCIASETGIRTIPLFLSTQA